VIELSASERASAALTRTRYTLLAIRRSGANHYPAAGVTSRGKLVQTNFVWCSCPMTNFKDLSKTPRHSDPEVDILGQPISRGPQEEASGVEAELEQKP